MSYHGSVNDWTVVRHDGVIEDAADVTYVVASTGKRDDVYIRSKSFKLWGECLLSHRLSLVQDVHERRS